MNNPTRVQIREQKWIQCFSNSTKSMAVFQQLVQTYSDHRRHYHNVQHIDFLLCNLEQHLPNFAHDQGFNLAIWFHDAKYHPLLPHNENRSVKWMKEITKPLMFSPKTILQAEKLIMATKHMKIQNLDKQQKYMHDLDMLILAAEGSDYAAYALQIKREVKAFGGAMLFSYYRKRFLAQLLASTTIFQSDIFRSYNEKAQHNLNREYKGTL